MSSEEYANAKGISTQVIMGGESHIVAIFRFMGQMFTDWLIGIIFIKTRSLLPAQVFHYLTDFFGGVIPYFFEMEV